MYVNVCGSVACPALSEAAVPPFCSAGYGPVLPAAPTSTTQTWDRDAGHKNCLRNRGATVVAKGQQPSGHCHKPTEGMHRCLQLPEKVLSAQLCPVSRLSYRCDHGQLRATRLTETAISFVPGVTLSCPGKPLPAGRGVLVTVSKELVR